MFTKTPADTAASGPVTHPVPAVTLASAPGDAPIPHAVGVSDDEFRAALSRLAAGVVLITAHDPDSGPHGEDAGMTATAFLSVSLDPPLVMVSVRNDSRMDDLLELQPDWAVSVLSGHQRQIAGRFAMKGRISDRLLFEDIPFVRGEASGAPLIGGALATLECRTEQRVVAGDHTLVIARVLATTIPNEDDGPLTYFRGKYHQLG
ncbi:flavin reductase family protein [Streptomyces sp. Isolate_219]|uniref:flavin reductase family protein n=1 Tax=Streptomyces sp. Isolate_219 TaxID=2950110 RepID=UPI0021C769D5|nr:flavin reductase family protein [Streptomyces sp. Isolate_219]MCR8574108.1 flavin reductase family protein [Streptomyces sp. Isolate_219]